jgi:hypothetical protein
LFVAVLPAFFEVLLFLVSPLFFGFGRAAARFALALPLAALRLPPALACFFAIALPLRSALFAPEGP